jgi:LysM repeat protein
MRRLKYILPLVLILSLLVSSVAFAAPAQQWGGYWYPVKFGDTLYSIGRATGTSPWAIAQANGLYPPYTIYAGSSLWIPGGYPPPHPRPNPYPGCGYWAPVYFGDTLASIAWRTGVSSWAIAAANGLYNPNLIYAGTSLWIPCSGGPAHPW